MPRCKHCKEKFDPAHFNQKFCLKSECTKVWVETEKEKQWRKRKRKLKEESETVQSLMKKAQKVFNEYIRLRDKDKPCVSCGRKLTGKYDAGHFYSSGGHKSVTFHEDNVHGQCVHCNQHKHGNLHEYNEGIKERIGQARFLELRSQAQETKKYTREELREKIVYLSKQLNFMNMETVLICGECLSGSVSQHAYDDEGWGVCNDCGAVEQDSIEISIDYFERIIDFSLSFKEKLKILEEAEQDLTNETEL